MGRNGAIVLLLLVGIGVLWLANTGKLHMMLASITNAAHSAPPVQKRQTQ